jgi:transcriptional regulator with XRE-family HTH domain
MVDLTEIVAIRVRQVRTAKGWTQEELADRVGLSVRYIGMLERGVNSPTVRVLSKLAAALQVDPLELIRRAKPKDKIRP